MTKKAAGFGVRLIADILDFFILVISISTVLFLLKGEYSIEWSTGWTWQIIYTLYLTFIPLVWGGYVIGKRILKIKIKRINEEEITFKHMFLREVVGKFLVMNITFGLSAIISVFMVVFREDKRAVHDLIAGTYVSYER
ncbi:putative RDD family membrane protein YckC [Cytobacillus eiseniae]|uniref:RDD family membrane protein YckC n=1 Tax=Cytobacillus eiseniae TaxID=762947 RepID=A0ABS4REY7_9BACI|nr:RDD family protein [Cytobacillus eiseniae]MBP2241482.1 putative RDD family membrane protein YckC [Cytobacillus eiseniae]